MRILITGGRVVDPASGLDLLADVAIADGRIAAIGAVPQDFQQDRTINAAHCWVLPGLVDLQARLREPGYEHAGMLATELSAAVAGGVTSLVCPPDTDPVLDEPGLVEMLRLRAQTHGAARVFPLGALTRGLCGQALTEMGMLTQAGCVGFSQAEKPVQDTSVLMRALQYAATFGYTVWLRPMDAFLSGGVAASGALASRLGLPSVPVAAETVALHTLFELVRATGARVHVCRISSAAGVELVRQAKADGLPVTCDVSVHNLHLIDADIGYFDSRFHLAPVLRQQRDRAALRAALAEGTIDALVSDHTPVGDDEKTLPFAQATAGASSIELLLSLVLKWANSDAVPLARALAAVTSAPANIVVGAMPASKRDLLNGLGQLVVGGAADVCVFDPHASWLVEPSTLKSQSKLSAFAFDAGGSEMPGRVRFTFVGGRLAFEA